MLSEAPIIKGFVQWLHTLSAQGGMRVVQFVTADTRYQTPEVEAVGAQAIAAIYTKVFDDAKSVTIRVLNMADGQDGHTVFLRWDRLIISNTSQKQTLSGVTEIMVGLNGKISSITEYWDSMPEPLHKRSYFAKLFGK